MTSLRAFYISYVRENLAKITASHVIDAFISQSLALNNNQNSTTTFSFAQKCVFSFPEHYLHFERIFAEFYDYANNENSQLLEFLELAPEAKEFLTKKWLASALRHSESFKEIILMRF